MPEHTTKHKFKIYKRLHHKRVVAFEIIRRIYPNTLYFKVPLPKDQQVGEIMCRTPEWLKDLVDRMNKGEIKFNRL